MKQILAIGLVALFVFGGQAAASFPKTASAISPGIVHIEGVGTFGAAVCQLIDPTAALGCEVAPGGPPGSPGGAFFNVSEMNGGGAVARLDVTASTTLPAGEFVMSIGNDRDDDTFVTNGDTNGDQDACDGDTTGSCVGHDHGTNLTFDDQFKEAFSSSGTAATTVCFAHDTEVGWGGVGAGDTVADDAWDDIVVFVGMYVDSTLTPAVGSYVGPVNVVLDLVSQGTDASNAGCSATFDDTVGWDI
jgi:hypothetical protein